MFKSKNQTHLAQKDQICNINANAFIIPQTLHIIEKWGLCVSDWIAQVQILFDAMEFILKVKSHYEVNTIFEQQNQQQS